MNAQTPLESLFDVARGTALPLPPDLARLYGRLASLIVAVLMIGSGFVQFLGASFFSHAFAAALFVFALERTHAAGEGGSPGEGVGDRDIPVAQAANGPRRCPDVLRSEIAGIRVRCAVMPPLYFRARLRN